MYRDFSARFSDAVAHAHLHDTAAHNHVQAVDDVRATNTDRATMAEGLVEDSGYDSDMPELEEVDHRSDMPELDAQCPITVIDGKIRLRWFPPYTVMIVFLGRRGRMNEAGEP